MSPATPYYAVIFTNVLTDNAEGYSEMADAMEQLASKQPGYLDFEHARDTLGISISYWTSLEAIANWKENVEHLHAQKIGKDQWYKWYRVRVCKVERDYEFVKKR